MPVFMQSLVTYYIPSDVNSRMIADALASEGINSQPFIEGSFDPSRSFFLINGDGYKHHKTRSIVRRLKKFTRNLGYLHIDAHDDLEDETGSVNSYQSFVSGIAKDIGGNNVNLFSDTLDLKLKEELMFYRPFISKWQIGWDGPFKELTGERIYVSTDLDCLDGEVHTLFPRKKLIGFSTRDLISVLKNIKRRYHVVGGDICGFSVYIDKTQKISLDNESIEKSLANIVSIIKTLV